jgi:hypothetical protein
MGFGSGETFRIWCQKFFILERSVVAVDSSTVRPRLEIVFDELSIKAYLSRRARLPCKPQPGLDS